MLFNSKSSRAEKQEQQLVEAWVELFFLKKQNDEMKNAISSIIAAIEDKGAVPQYHNHVMRKHKEEWPTLWNAIDKAIKAYYIKPE